MLKVAFRVDSSKSIGTGHVMRCLVLAAKLSKYSYVPIFFVSEQPGEITFKIKEFGFEIIRLDTNVISDNSMCSIQLDAEITLHHCQKLNCRMLIVDHYSLDAEWEKTVRPVLDWLFVIDDRANRPHLADVLLDQNVGRRIRDYEKLVPSSCHMLIGPQFALLRDEFNLKRTKGILREFKKPLSAIISFGGSDLDNASGRVLEFIYEKAEYFPIVEIKVVLGRNSLWIDSLKKQIQRAPIKSKLLVEVPDMSEKFLWADIAIGAGGTTSWERCCMGLPSLLINIADNQSEISAELDRLGAAKMIGMIEDEHWKNEFFDFLVSPELEKKLENMSKAAYNLSDGNGAARVANILVEKHYENRYPLR